MYRRTSRAWRSLHWLYVVGGWGPKVARMWPLGGPGKSWWNTRNGAGYLNFPRPSHDQKRCRLHLLVDWLISCVHDAHVVGGFAGLRNIYALTAT